MAEEEAGGWRLIVAQNLVDCPPWRSAVRSISYADESEQIMHDNPLQMDDADKGLDESWEQDFYSGPIIVLVAQFFVAQQWARHVYDMIPDHASLYLLFWSESDGAVSFTTTDQLLSERTSKEPLLAERLAAEFRDKRDQLLKDELAGSMHAPAPGTHCYRLSWEALYEKRSFACLEQLLPTREQHFQQYLRSHEGGGKEVAMPLSFWNYRARRHLGLPTE